MVRVHAAAEFNAAKDLKEAGRYLEAAVHFHKALSLDPHDPDAAYMLGNTLSELGELASALLAYDAALALRPSSPDILTNRGVVLRSLGRVEEAISCHRAALALAPHHAEAHFNLALSLLTSGTFTEGWKEYEWRWALPSFPNGRRQSEKRRWDGIPTPDTVLLRAEQGYGDTIQFVRFAEHAAQKVGRLLLECPAELSGLLKNVRGFSEVCVSGSPLPAYDAELPLGSLAYVLGISGNDLAPRFPYVVPSQKIVATWSQRVSSTNRFAAGLVWSGRRGTAAQAARSCPFNSLLPLLQLDGISWFSLQKELPAEEIPLASASTTDWSKELTDFEQTAGALACLDLVVTIDTAVAHVAGAMGKPVILLLPSVPDWRWMIGKEESPWYPTIRILRQSRPGDWTDVVDKATKLVAEWISLRRTTSTPENGPALVARGNSACANGDLDSAEKFFREATGSSASAFAAWFNLGNVLSARERITEAIESYTRACALNPQSPQAWHNLGVHQIRSTNIDEGLSSLQRAVGLLPSSADFQTSLGNGYAAAGNSMRALECYEVAARLDPRSPHSLYNMGEELLKQGRYEQAAEAYRRVLSLDPAFLPAYHNLGFALMCCGEVDEAIRAYQSAPDPLDPELNWNLAQALLLKGDFEHGWPLYENRWHTAQFRDRRRQGAVPEWDGSPLNGRTILLYCEQGLGDALQFVRYAALLADQGATVIFESRPELKNLRIHGVARMVSVGEDPGPCDYQCSLLSLPFFLKTTVSAIPADVPYLDVDIALLEMWRRRMECPPQFKRVGIVWKGRASGWKERLRPVPLTSLEPLLEMDGIQFFNLQLGDTAGELGAVRSKRAIIDLTGEIHSFADTAALMLNLDLVITVDTAAAHLAGALGIPVWTMLPSVPDWRWFIGRNDSPWYPTMTLFRQRRPGNWQEVMAEMTTRLHGLLSPGKVTQQKSDPTLAEADRLHVAGDLAGGLRLYAAALEKGERSAQLYNNMGLLLGEIGKPEAAKECFTKAIELDPTNVASLNNLGMWHVGAGNVARALPLFLRALRNEPWNAAVRNNCGMCLTRDQDSSVEIAAYRAALRTDDGLVDAHWNLALAALAAGLFEEGWREYEWRWRKPDFTSPRRNFQAPAWEGEPLMGKTLLVHAEQGFGDTVQFSRFVPLLEHAGGKVIFEVQPELLTLVRMSMPSVDVFPRGEEPPPFDCHAPLMSLPHYLRTRADCVPAGVPYLKVQDDRLARARTLVSPAEGAISVGIVWQGRPSQHHNTRRSVPVSLFSPLMDIDGVNWCSLQTGEAVHLLPEGRSGRRCHDLGSGFTDFADTAAVMAHLDVVIAVDTAVAHLAGALGKELWLLLSSPADWRWMHGRNDSLWYPTCRVFRQPRPGDWQSVIQTVQQKLSRMTERKRTPEKREQ